MQEKLQFSHFLTVQRSVGLDKLKRQMIARYKHVYS